MQIKTALISLLHTLSQHDWLPFPMRLSLFISIISPRSCISIFLSKAKPHTKCIKLLSPRLRTNLYDRMRNCHFYAGNIDEQERADERRWRYVIIALLLIGEIFALYNHMLGRNSADGIEPDFGAGRARIPWCGVPMITSAMMDCLWLCVIFPQFRVKSISIEAY